MTRLILALAFVGGVVLCRVAWMTRTARALGCAAGYCRCTFVPEPDPMAQPFLDSRNSATYLYNPTTRVVTSYN